MNQIKIRYAKNPDLEFMLNGFKEIERIETGDVWIEKFLKRSDRPQKIRKAIRRKNILVATLGKKPVGIIWFTISNKVPYGVNYGIYTKKYMWIDFSFVSRKFRKRGIGTMLYKEAFKIAARKKIRTVFVDVFSANRNSVQFHEKIGFKPKIYLLIREI